MCHGSDRLVLVPILQGGDNLLLSEPQRFSNLVATKLLASQHGLSQRRSVGKALKH